MRWLRPGPRIIASAALAVTTVTGLGCGAPSFLVTPVQNAYTLDEAQVEPGHGLFPDKIAVIGVEGTLANAPAGGLLTPTENPVSRFVQELQKAADDNRVKAVVLRVNSPGGTVSSADAMYQILKRFRAKTHKPVVASGQELVASGAYYLSCAADKIVAQPTTLVGSIGVIFETYNLQGTMGKLGVRSEAYKSAAHKDIGSPFRASTPDEQQIFQSLVDEYYARFKKIVTDNRPIPPAADFAQITDGRVYSGAAAAQIGLVDQVGLLDDAIALAKDLAHAKDAQVVAYHRPYGYGGSIYATTDAPAPRAASDTLKLQLPDATTFLPAGFYYMWQP
jgi:protease-4